MSFFNMINLIKTCTFVTTNSLYFEEIGLFFIGLFIQRFFIPFIVNFATNNILLVS